jgi:hypothetical protein
MGSEILRMRSSPKLPAIRPWPTSVGGWMIASGYTPRAAQSDHLLAGSTPVRSWACSRLALSTQTRRQPARCGR